MKANIPETDRKRVVIIGAGFGGLAISQKLAQTDDFQVVLVDKLNYHQFQPLFYQVATAGLEPSAISFPLRLVFQNNPHVHVRVTEVTSINTAENHILTQLGRINYDYLVLAIGADTNFFGMTNIQDKALPMKSVSEALGLRNRILQNFEDAITVENEDDRQGLLNIVVVGGGPTGVEVSGTLAEMKRHILPKDYPELDFDAMQVYLIESSAEVLDVMSDGASKNAKKYLQELGVNVINGKRVVDFDGKYAKINDGSQIRTNNLVWAAGIKANFMEGIEKSAITYGGRIKVNQFNQVEGLKNVFAIGDLAYMEEETFPKGHPQVAQPAIQQGNLLALNLASLLRGNELKPFKYNDLGSMATIGRNKAVVDLPYFKFAGFFAWLTWMFVHLMSLVGIKNRVMIFISWLWNYVTYDQSLRLIIKAKTPKT
ncbi:MAG: NAD(P)/FAD-dependent oxidoreductase [Bacteroidota bacterium]